ncbi:MAG: NfeD family protein [Bacteroidales bacterium OttesenSCG-928-I14]|jgi:membrane-bound ClpP family serine protease|nr:NfeD family protein [Bacteroidales bacterium OttesenSCG-928-I14]
MFRSKIFNKIALNSKIDSTVIDENILNICEGDEGISVSRLNPVGKVEVNNMILEGKSLGRFIDEDTKVIVIKVTSTQLIVKIK